LLRELEKSAKNAFINDFTSLLSVFIHPDKVCIRLLSVFEYDNLKAVLGVLENEEAELPELTDLGKFGILNWQYWPNLRKITEKTPFGWVADDHEKKVPLRVIYNKLDKQYCRDVFSSLKELDSETRRGVKSIIGEEFVLKNLIWALQLRIYHKLSVDKIVPLLVTLTDSDVYSDSIVMPAIFALRKKVSDYSDWKNWHYSSLVNSPSDVSDWVFDPTYFEQRVNDYIGRVARRVFRSHQFSAAMLVSFFHLKQQELAYIRGASNAIYLNLNMEEISNFYKVEV
jgi:vacuolar-type H+-ATPase subunit C/Vma6